MDSEIKDNAELKVKILLTKFLNTSGPVDVSRLRNGQQSLSTHQRVNILKNVTGGGTTKTALHKAAYEGHITIVKCLLKDLSEVERLELLEIQNMFGSTTVHLAALAGHKFIINSLLKGIPVDLRFRLLRIQDGDGGTAIFNAAQNSCTDALECLLQDLSGDQRLLLLNIKDRENNTAIYKAADCGHTDNFKYLLESVPEDQKIKLLNIQDVSGVTPLHRAASIGHTNIVGQTNIKILLAVIPESLRLKLLKIEDEYGNTALHKAASGGHADAVKCIMEVLSPEQRKELYNIPNRNGETALAIAENQNKENVVEYLRSCEAPGFTESGQGTATVGEASKVMSTHLMSDDLLRQALQNSATTSEDDGSVDKLLGKGAYGSVYLHNDLHTNTVVAVKKVDFGPIVGDVSKEVKALRNEISIMEKLDNGRIVKYIRSEMQLNSLCIYMEYMNVGSVKEQLQKNGAFSEVTTKKYTIHILEGLVYLHSQGIIHRDVKGSNVLCDTNGNIRLADFGVSKLLSNLQTLTSQTNKITTEVGTVHWMAPEVMDPSKDGYGRRADIWSTGATVVEMLSTNPPWHKLESLQVMFQVGLLGKVDYVLAPTTSKDAEDFLALTFQSKDQRPGAEDLLGHYWLNTATGGNSANQ